MSTTDLQQQLHSLEGCFQVFFKGLNKHFCYELTGESYFHCWVIIYSITQPAPNCLLQFTFQCLVVHLLQWHEWPTMKISHQYYATQLIWSQTAYKLCCRYKPLVRPLITLQSRIHQIAFSDMSLLTNLTLISYLCYIPDYKQWWGFNLWFKKWNKNDAYMDLKGCKRTIRDAAGMRMESKIAVLY